MRVLRYPQFAAVICRMSNEALIVAAKHEAPGRGQHTGERSVGAPYFPLRNRVPRERIETHRQLRERVGAELGETRSDIDAEIRRQRTRIEIAIRRINQC